MHNTGAMLPQGIRNLRAHAFCPPDCYGRRAVRGAEPAPLLRIFGLHQPPGKSNEASTLHSANARSLIGYRNLPHRVATTRGWP